MNTVGAKLGETRGLSGPRETAVISFDQLVTIGPKSRLWTEDWRLKETGPCLTESEDDATASISRDENGTPGIGLCDFGGGSGWKPLSRESLDSAFSAGNNRGFATIVPPEVPP